MNYKLKSVNGFKHIVRVTESYFVCPYCEAKNILSDPEHVVKKRVSVDDLIRCDGCNKRILIKFNYPIFKNT